MCIALPQKIKKINNNQIILENGEVIRFKTAKVKVGDYVLVQNNAIVKIINKKEAQKILKLIKNLKRTENNERDIYI